MEKGERMRDALSRQKIGNKKSASVWWAKKTRQICLRQNIGSLSTKNRLVCDGFKLNESH